MSTENALKLHVKHDLPLDQLYIDVSTSSTVADAIGMVSEQIGLPKELIELWMDKAQPPEKPIVECGGLF